MANAPLIDQEFLERLERLTIHWQKSFAGLVGGHNMSRFAGPGQEFLEHRNFHAGDDLRSVNWRAYMRLDKMFLKMFQVEPRVPVRLLLDTSQSMKTGHPDKFLYARQLAAALCYVGLVRLDSIQLQPFAENLTQHCTAGGGRHRFRPVVEFLTNLKCEGATNLLEISRQFLSRYTQRGLVIVISDFLDDSDPVRALQYLADFGHELLLVQLWADEDRTPPWTGDLEIVDAETHQQMRVAFDDHARAAYTVAFDDYAAQIRRTALQSGGRYLGLPVSMPLEQAIFGEMISARGIA